MSYASCFSILAGGEGGWGGGGMPNSNKVIYELGLEMYPKTFAEAAAEPASGNGNTFQFPPHPNHTGQKSPLGGVGVDPEGDPAPITNRERSISAPNVSHTIINSEHMLPTELSHFGHAHKDIRSKSTTLHRMIDMIVNFRFQLMAWSSWMSFTT